MRLAEDGDLVMESFCLDYIETVFKNSTFEEVMRETEEDFFEWFIEPDAVNKIAAMKSKGKALNGLLPQIPKKLNVKVTQEALGLVEAGALNLSQAIARLSEGPAHLLGLSANLKTGAPADVVIFDPAARWVPGPDTLVGRARNTPFIGQSLPGPVRCTLVGGEVVWQIADGEPKEET